ncbi:hypothetical protein JCM9279_004993 [Rhodotorula babjevae]
MPTKAQNQATKSAQEGGYVEWTVFYKTEKDRLKAEHPEWDGRKIQAECGETYRLSSPLESLKRRRTHQSTALDLPASPPSSSSEQDDAHLDDQEGSSRSKSRILDWPTFYDHEAALVRAKTPNIKHKVLMKRVSSKWRKQKAELLQEAQEDAEVEGAREEEAQKAQKEEKGE